MWQAARTVVVALALGGCGGDDSVELDGGLGAAYVEARQCAVCHQSANPADGTLSGQAAPFYGTNLTPDVATGLGGWADVQIVRALRAGVDNQGGAICAPMPRYPQMSDDEADAIVAYLRALPAVRRDDLPPFVCQTSDGGVVDLSMPPVIVYDLSQPAPPPDLGPIETPPDGDGVD
jgi:mono/diheme cytochrome c family protein